MTDALFPPTPRERLDFVAAFTSKERRYRVHMQKKYGADPGQHIYWQERVAQCDVALAHLAALATVVGP